MFHSAGQMVSVLFNILTSLANRDARQRVQYSKLHFMGRNLYWTTLTLQTALPMFSKENFQSDGLFIPKKNLII